MSSLGTLLASAAFLLGIINLIQVNLPKIQRREKDWAYKALMLGSMLLTIAIGLIEGPKRMDSYHFAQAQGAPINEAIQNSDELSIKAMVLPVPESTSTPAVATEQTLRLQPIKNGMDLAPGQDPRLSLKKVTDAEKKTSYVLIGDKRIQELEVLESTGADALNLPIGIKSTRSLIAYKWIFDRILFLCQPPCLHCWLLHCFRGIRAFRARNLEATILLAAACIVMLAQVPIGEQLPFVGEYLAQFKNWILDTPNVAARRAIYIGAALGAISTGLRIVLGIERSHLGGD